MTYSEIYKSLCDKCKPARVMAVSKTRTLEEVQLAYSSGIRLFGENHVQEIVEKFSSWHPEDIEIHMIGHLQSNKVNKVVPLVDMIESVDSYNLLLKINNCAEKAGKIMPVLLEINTSEESAKSGFESEDTVCECLEKSKELKNVRIAGFMTVGPIDHNLAFKSFDKLRTLGIEFRRIFPTVGNILSMGMSQDYKTALQCGSTQVRIGTMIFGERNYSK